MRASLSFASGCITIVIILARCSSACLRWSSCCACCSAVWPPPPPYVIYQEKQTLVYFIMSGRFLECIKGYASSSVVMLTHPSCPHCPHYLWILCIEGESERESGREGERVGEREGARATETQSVCVFSFTLNPSKLCLQSVLINWALHILNLAAM